MRFGVMSLLALFPAALSADPSNDVVATSANGRFRFEARTKDSSPFPKDFTYSLYQTKPEKLVWSYKQKEDELPPWNAWVSDEGRTVLRSVRDDLTVYQADGKITWEMGLIEHALTADEAKTYVRLTDHTRDWSGYSHWYFATIDGRAHFCIRPWWNRRILLDLEASKQVPADGKAAAALDAAERTFVLEALARGVEMLEKLGPGKDDDRWGRASWPVLEAAHLAGRIRCKEALPLLGKLERSSLCHRSGGCSAFRDSVHDGDIHPYDSREFTLRRVAQLSIRRLGGTPTGLPATALRVHRDKELGPIYVPKVHETPRSNRVDFVKKGMTVKEVLDALGAPDQLDWTGGEQVRWEYDIDDAKPYTCRVVFDKVLVDRVEKIVPPRWESGDSRDRDLAY